MGHMLGAVDQAKLDEQRGVVQNEKRQGENQPYAVSYELITKNTFPQGHPYSWTVIGEMEDLDAASLEDVHEWFRTYYGAANAVISIAGDIGPEEARELVERYFGSIPSGPPVARQQSWIARRTGEHRQKVEDRVPQARVMKVWNVPEWGTREAVLLDLATDVLAAGKSSRLYKRLVYEDQIATSATAYIQAQEIAGQVVVQATAHRDGKLAEVEATLDEELRKFLQSGPTDDELARAKMDHKARFIRGAERIGGFGGKSRHPRAERGVCGRSLPLQEDAGVGRRCHRRGHSLDRCGVSLRRCLRARDSPGPPNVAFPRARWIVPSCRRPRAFRNSRSPPQAKPSFRTD